MIDSESDLAVLAIDAASAKPIAWGNSDRVEIGNIVLAVGSPFGLSQSVTMGIVSARGRALRLEKKNALVNQDFIQTDAAINFGNSGGPLIDVNGQLIGINTAIASQSGGNDGIGFSIPSNLVRRVVNDLFERGEVQRAYLGVMLDPDFTPEKARELKLDRVHGARITEVYQNSPAARAGLLANDVVLSFDGIEVIDENHLINLVSLTQIGRKVALVVLRNGQRVTVDVHLSDRHEMSDQSEAPHRPGMGSLVEPLGLTLHEVSRDLALELGLAPTTRGLLVLRVDPQSALAENVDVYDVLEEIGRTPVATVTDARSAWPGKRSTAKCCCALLAEAPVPCAVTSSCGDASARPDGSLTPSVSVRAAITRGGATDRERSPWDARLPFSTRRTMSDLDELGGDKFLFVTSAIRIPLSEFSFSFAERRARRPECQQGKQQGRASLARGGKPKPQPGNARPFHRAKPPPDHDRRPVRDLQPTVPRPAAEHRRLPRKTPSPAAGRGGPSGAAEKTKPTAGSRRRRVADKRLHSAAKQRRRRMNDEG